MRTLFTIMLFIDIISQSQTLLVSTSTRKLMIQGVSAKRRPFYAKLIYNGGFCGAAVISARYALTAGHCAFVNKRKFFPSSKRKNVKFGVFLIIVPPPPSLVVR